MTNQEIQCNKANGICRDCTIKAIDCNFIYRAEQKEYLGYKQLEAIKDFGKIYGCNH